MNIFELRQEAEGGSLVAQTLLGISYLEGIEIDINYTDALRWLSSAADKGVPRACYHLARMYMEGLGVSKDFPRALGLYGRAARRGEFFAQIELGRIYSRGIGAVSQDHNAAEKWYSAAAAQEGTITDCEELREAKAFLRSRT
jgi:uncharacterized protein